MSNYPWNQQDGFVSESCFRVSLSAFHSPWSILNIKKNAVIILSMYSFELTWPRATPWRTSARDQVHIPQPDDG